MRETFDGQHQSGRGRRQWPKTRYRPSCGAERARLAYGLARLVISFRFSHSGFYNNPSRSANRPEVNPLPYKFIGPLPRSHGGFMEMLYLLITSRR